MSMAAEKAAELQANRQTGLVAAALDAGADPADGSFQDDDLEVDEGANFDAPDQPEFTDDPEPAAESEGDVDLSEFPEDYFGYNVREYAEKNGVDAGKAYHEALKAGNRAVNDRLQKLAEERQRLEQMRREAELQAQGTPPEPDEPASDEELLEAYGIDPNIMQYDEIGKPITALVQRLAAMENELSTRSQQDEFAQWESQVDRGLDQLERQHGALPAEYAREDLKRFALENQIGDPSALYWTIAGPLQAQAARGGLVPEPTPQPDNTRKRRVASGGKPRSVKKEATQGAKPKDLREIFKQVKDEQGVTGDPFAHREPEF